MIAREMFEELGYEVTIDDEYQITYVKDNECKYREITFWYEDVRFSVDDMDIHDRYISMDLLNAINQQCRELGWI